MVVPILSVEKIIIFLEVWYTLNDKLTVSLCLLDEIFYVVCERGIILSMSYSTMSVKKLSVEVYYDY